MRITLKRSEREKWKLEKIERPLLHICFHGMVRINILNPRVASICPAMGFNSLFKGRKGLEEEAREEGEGGRENPDGVLAPFAVDGVFRDSPEVEEALNVLWPEDVEG